MSEPLDDISLRRSHVVVLSVVLVVASILRFAHLGQPVYLLDEIWHAELSTGRGSVHTELPRGRLLSAIDRPTSLQNAPPWYAIWTHMNGATHPPLYLLALRAWRAVFGEGEAMSRALSAIASLIAMVLLFDAARHLSGPRAALWAAALFAVAGPQVTLARELRGYAFAEMWALGAAAALARTILGGVNVRRVAALFTCAFAAVLTHYFAALTLLGLGCCALTFLRGRTRNVSAAVLIASVALFVIIWTPQLLQQRRAVPGLENADAVSRQNWLSDPVQGHVSHSLQRFVQLPLRLLVDPPDGYGVWGWIGIAPLVIALALIAQRRQRALAFWLLWFGCSAGGLLALDLARSTRLLDFIRYSLIAGAAVCAIVPLLAPRSWKAAWPRLVIPGVVTLLVAIRLPLAYDKPTPDVRSVAAYLDQNAQPNDVVTFFPAEGMDWYAGNAYAGVAHYSRSYPWPFVILSQPADDELMSSLRGHTVWLFSGSDRIPPARILPGAQPLQRQYFEGTGTVTRLSVP